MVSWRAFRQLVSQPPQSMTSPCLALALRWLLASLFPKVGLLRTHCFQHGIQTWSSQQVGRQRHVDDDVNGAAEEGVVGGGSGRMW